MKCAVKCDRHGEVPDLVESIESCAQIVLSGYFLLLFVVQDPRCDRTREQHRRRRKVLISVSWASGTRGFGDTSSGANVPEDAKGGPDRTFSSDWSLDFDKMSFIPVSPGSHDGLSLWIAERVEGFTSCHSVGYRDGRFFCLARRVDVALLVALSSDVMDTSSGLQSELRDSLSGIRVRLTPSRVADSLPNEMKGARKCVGSVALSVLQSVELDTTVFDATEACTDRQPTNFWERVAPAWGRMSSMENLWLCRHWTCTLAQNPDPCSCSLLFSTGFTGYTWASCTGNLVLLST